jgi:copper ion binding protein
MSTQIFSTEATVEGMTCQHCVASVTEEVGLLPGVQRVTVDLGSGRVSLLSGQLVTTDALRRAITEAGYQLVS